MPFVTRQSLFTLTLLAGLAILAVVLFVWSGIYNIGADDTHTKPVYAVLQALREKSIERHARDLKAPDLTDAALIRSGAGNYAAMCVGCHLAPGVASTELSRGLYPQPPNLARRELTKPSLDFWVIKHGIKASGMPAWGKSMEDRYIWGMVAFLQQLPKLDAAGYQKLVASSGGHSHGGGESGEHHHHDEAEEHHDEAAGEPMAAGGMAGMTHVHADGSTHVHADASAATQGAEHASSEHEH